MMGVKYEGKDYIRDNGKCYNYAKTTGYDGIDYGCYKFTLDTSDHVIAEAFEPIDGVCENPYLSKDKGTGTVVVGIVLVTLLLF
ncbi:hypothetical protein QTN25_008641 [Entamoeba marina]